jgi:AraC-like DNA-binding protein
MLAEEDRAEASRIFEAIVNAKTAQHPYRDDLMRLLILELFILVGKSCAPNVEQPINYNRLLLNNFKKLLEIHYKRYQFPRDYADLLYITPNHLNALCKDQLGISAGQLIRNRILLEAKRLLVNAEFTVQQIAVDLGFKDASYFVRFFKKYEQETPEKFRKKII